MLQTFAALLCRNCPNPCVFTLGKSCRSWISFLPKSHISMRYSFVKTHIHLENLLAPIAHMHAVCFTEIARTYSVCLATSGSLLELQGSLQYVLIEVCLCWNQTDLCSAHWLQSHRYRHVVQPGSNQADLCRTTFADHTDLSASARHHFPRIAPICAV